jgi:chemotaxis protein MotB
MNNRNFSRHEPANSIDELLSVTDRRQSTNWMLTYLDVFVLIVMLVVTLISLSNFDNSPEAPEKSINAHKAKSIPDATQPSTIESPQPTITDPTTEQVDETQTSAKQQNIASTEQLTKNEERTDPTIASELIAAEPTEPKIEQPEPESTAIESSEIIEPMDMASANETEPLREQAIQAQLNQQLAALGLSDSITMTVTQGYAQLEIQDNILYRSSEAILTPSGQSLLTRLTPMLQQSSGLIYIEGHTDNRPIKTKQFPSNWELGAARATSVLHFLSLQQLDETRMRAVTYADTKPIADNNSEQGRRKNRRVNIVIKVADDSN